MWIIKKLSVFKTEGNIGMNFKACVYNISSSKQKLKKLSPVGIEPTT